MTNIIENDDKKIFNDTWSYKLIYVFDIPDESHKWLLKVWDATIHYSGDISELKPNCSELNKAAKKRINEYTNTAWIIYNLRYTELAIRKNPKSWKLETFKDAKVHRVLMNSWFKKVKLEGTRAKEWFKVDLNTAIASIDAYKKWKWNKNTHIPNKNKLQTASQ